MVVTSSVREALLHVGKKMPMAPVILAQLGRMLLYADSDLADAIELLKRDPALTARIIRLANSIVYGAGRPVGSLEESLARVGYNEVYRLTGLAAVAEMSNRPLPLYGITAAQFRENSVLTALLIERMAVTAGLMAGDAYTAGLLRSVGKIALDQLVSAGARQPSYSNGGDVPLADWERPHLGLSNGEAGALVLSGWRFPAATVMAVCEHYEPGPRSGALSNLLNLAAGAAERCGHGLPGEHSYWQPDPAKLEVAGIDELDIALATNDALESFGPIRAVLA